MDMLDQLNVGTKLSKKELKEISGGLSVSPTLINAFNKTIGTLYEIGQNFGTSIRRIIFNDLCPF